MRLGSPLHPGQSQLINTCVGFTLAFALLELARHPLEQQRLREELGKEVAHPEPKERDSTASAASPFSLLKCVVKETLRLHPIR